MLLRKYSKHSKKLFGQSEIKKSSKIEANKELSDMDSNNNNNLLNSAFNGMTNMKHSESFLLKSG